MNIENARLTGPEVVGQGQDPEPVAPEVPAEQPKDGADPVVEQPAGGETVVETSTSEVPASDAPVTEDPVIETVDQSQLQALQAELEQLRNDPYYKLLSEDENARKIADAYAANKLWDYAKVQNTDYDGMNSEQIILEDIRRSNPTASENAIRALYEDRVAKYTPDDEDDPRAEVKQELFDLEAAKIRERFNKEKSEFEIPQYQPKEVEQPQQVDPEVVRQSIEAESAIVALRNEKVVKSTIDEQSFNHEINPDQVVEMAVSWGNFASLLKNPDGTPDWSKFAKVVAFAQDPDAWDARVAGWMKSQGRKEVVDELENPSTIQQAPPAKDVGPGGITGAKLVTRN